MSDELKAGLTASRRYDVDAERTISFEEVRVYSTPSLLYDIEVVCRDLLLDNIEPGKDSVGTRIELDHIGATLKGMWVDISVTITEVNGGAVTFDFTAHDALEKVAKGTHSRFIIPVEKTKERLKKKLEKAMEIQG